MLTNDWEKELSKEFKKAYFLELQQFLEKEYREGSNLVFPKWENIFQALHTTNYENTKAVILGQDPYHGPGQAHGLSFSVQPDVKVPPSLKNIYKELHKDLGHSIPNHGYLQSWAEEGVLLLNTVLTVKAHEPNSHKGKGWEKFTDEVIRALNRREQPVVFILWGKHAEEKRELITASHHHIITSPHPSPFSANRGFFGSKPFSRTNEFLRKNEITEINWELPVEL
ncbi:uracil-DNA glycosylase [Evansella vedderi]|uniref:Uracil-DNA glycosylase n=1 Tax=Evansella vedderi TaxID=38282 RepID=A0ABU0A1Q3_9BACI|nr:uracil-DNA glycosylase [Evansella vedderi]MDQ0257418.1 uracil-DNA glycosylase [Evansella vedderi]